MNKIDFATILMFTGTAVACLAALYAIWIYIWKPYRKRTQKLIARVCGHTTSIRGALDFNLPGNDEHFHFKGELPTNEDGQPDYCHACISDMVIPCAWCGNPILPGEPITLYSPVKEDYVPKKGARIYTRDLKEGNEDRWHVLKAEGNLPKNPSFVGCLGWDCAETGADRAGFWNVPGRVVRTPSPIEMMMAGEEAILISDMSDQKEAAKMAERHAELTSSSS